MAKAWNPNSSVNLFQVQSTDRLDGVSAPQQRTFQRDGVRWSERDGVQWSERGMVYGSGAHLMIWIRNIYQLMIWIRINMMQIRKTVKNKSVLC